MGTSFCSTVATSTAGGDGGWTAEELVEQEETLSSAAVRRPANFQLEFEIAMYVIVIESRWFEKTVSLGDGPNDTSVGSHGCSVDRGSQWAANESDDVGDLLGGCETLKNR